MYHRPVASKEVKDIVRRLNDKTASRVDLISNRALKKKPSFTVSWKLAKVIIIPKTGKLFHAAVNYRPISLLSGVVFERTLFSRILS